MTTIEIKTIKPGGGGDYTNLADWETGERGDLVSADKIKVAEVYSGGTVGTVTLASANWTVDSTRYPIIRAAPGHGNHGKYDINKAFVGTIALTINFMVIGPGLSFSGAADITGTGDSTTTVQGNVFRSNGSFQIISRGGGTVNPHMIRNNILIGTGAVVTNLQVAGGKVAFYNNTVYATGFAGVLGHNTVVTTQNNYIAQTGVVPCYYYNINGGETFGDHDITSDGEAKTAVLRNVPYTTDTFLNVTSGSENLRLQVNRKARNILLDNGVDLSGSGVTIDIIGTPRFGKFDIGAFQNRNAKFIELF